MPISKDEFDKLPDVTSREGPAVSNEDLLEQLVEQGLTTKEVASVLGVKGGTAYSRLKRLLDDGKVVRKQSSGAIVWSAAD